MLREDLRWERSLWWHETINLATLLGVKYAGEIDGQDNASFDE